MEKRNKPILEPTTQENDILGDEGEQYARKLIHAGVQVTPLRVLPTHPDFAMLNALADTPATKVTLQIVSEKLWEALGTKSSAQSAWQPDAANLHSKGGE